jgi:hypothetical protein
MSGDTKLLYEILETLGRMEQKQSQYMYAKLKMDRDYYMAKNPEALMEGTRDRIERALDFVEPYS